MADVTPAPAPALAQSMLDILTRIQTAQKLYQTEQDYEVHQIAVEEWQAELLDLLCPPDADEVLDLPRLLAQQPAAQAPAEAGLWLGDKDGLSVAGLAHALTLLPKKRRAQEAEVFCNGEPVTGVSILGKHGQSMGEFQVYLQTEGQPRSASDIQIYPALAAAEAGEVV